MAVMNYRTEDGLADYGFSIDFHEEVGWRVYIVFEPNYQSDDNTMESPYRAIDPDGHPYVNWPLRITSLGDAKTVAELWAELDQRHHNQKKAGTTKQPGTCAS
jgi:hypothetical protein